MGRWQEIVTDCQSMINVHSNKQQQVENCSSQFIAVTYGLPRAPVPRYFSDSNNTDAKVVASRVQLLPTRRQYLWKTGHVYWKKLGLAAQSSKSTCHQGGRMLHRAQLVCPGR
jgi:hypothetical protein